jgi:hypothetical protein
LPLTLSSIVPPSVAFYHLDVRRAGIVTSWIRARRGRAGVCEPAQR